LKPYEFQEKLISRVRAAFGRTKRVLLQLCPGGGKTVIAAEISRLSATKSFRVWFICHRAELIFQTAKTYSNFGLEYGFIAAGYQQGSGSAIQICSIQTLAHRLGTVKPPDLMIFDECHHLGAAGWTRVKNYYPKAYVLGLSGTPIRLDGKSLGDHFHEMILGPSSRWLMDEGFLAEYDLYCPSRPDVSQVHLVAGDYNKHEIDEVMSSTSITGDVIEFYLDKGLGKRAMLFATSIKRSKAYAEDFRSQGVQAVHLDGKTDRGLRREMSLAVAEGQIDLLCNVNLFGEGYDLSAQAGKDCPIQVLLDAQPSLSLSRVLQMQYRTLRRQQGKAIIGDFSGNCFNSDGTVKHGLPDDDREWSLEATKKTARKSKPEEREIYIRQCPAPCHKVTRGSPTECPKCGREFEVRARKVEEVEGELVKVDKEMIRRKAKEENRNARTLPDLEALGRSRGYKPGWAAHIYKARKGRSW